MQNYQLFTLTECNSGGVNFWAILYTRTSQTKAAFTPRQHVAFNMWPVAVNMLVVIGNNWQQSCCQFVARLLLDTKDTSRP